MVISTKELLEKYKDFSCPKMKIKREIEKKTFFQLKKGLYETNEYVDGYLLCQYMYGPSYISFEYALSYYQMIPERVYTYTCATALTKHTFNYENRYGRFYYSDVPSSVFRFGIFNVVINGYSYNMATREKALCDLLYKKPPVKNILEIKQLLFENLRIDEDEFKKLNFEDIYFLANLYKCTNIYFLEKLIRMEYYE